MLGPDCPEYADAIKRRGTGFTYQDLARWLKRMDFSPPSKPKGSHRVWSHQSGRRAQLVESGHGEVKRWYTLHVAELLWEMGKCK